jgi:hypothetical protein
MTSEIANSFKTPIREAARPISAAPGAQRGSVVRATVPQTCDDCRAATAFQAWHSFDMTPAFNYEISFADYGIPPAGKRAVIELVTAQIIVPSGEWARLRMFTSLGFQASNLDLFLTFQGNVGGQAIYDATHTIRAYTDSLIDFNVNRDNAETSGSGLICISGYIAG